MNCSPAPVMADPVRVRQVLRHLVSNAIRYGGPNIGVATGSDGDSVWLQVLDDGDGVPEADVEAMFAPFSALDLSNPESVGIGLTVARSLAHLMDGTLDYSRDDRTRFTLCLPRAEAGGSHRSLTASSSSSHRGWRSLRV